MKLFVFDVDGTLVGISQRLRKKTIEALKKNIDGLKTDKVKLSTALVQLKKKTDELKKKNVSKLSNISLSILHSAI